MKVVLDSMLWVSYLVHTNGSRHRLIERARKARVRFFVSDYILDEVRQTLLDDFDETRRVAQLAEDAVLRQLHTAMSALVRSWWLNNERASTKLINRTAAKIARQQRRSTQARTSHTKRTRKKLRALGIKLTDLKRCQWDTT